MNENTDYQTFEYTCPKRVEEDHCLVTGGRCFHYDPARECLNNQNIKHIIEEND